MIIARGAVVTKDVSAFSIVGGVPKKTIKYRKKKGWAMNKLPNFICVGAQKAGTTTLHDILKEHPDIYLPTRKEAHFFDQEDRYEKGMEWWLNNFFSTYNDEKILGVMTPEYLYYENVPERIKKDLGKETKIILILRNPIDRAYSHYLMSLRRGHENLSFKNAINDEKERIKLGEFERNHFSYIDRGLYYGQICRYLNLFPKKNILILNFENDIKNNINRTIKNIELFLGVAIIELNTNKKSNQASKPRSKILNNLAHGNSQLRKALKPFILSEELRRKIINYINGLNQKPDNHDKLNDKIKADIFNRYYREEIENIETLLEINLDHWRYNA